MMQETFRIVTSGHDLALYEGNGTIEITMVGTEDDMSIELERESIKELIKALTDLL